MTTPDGREMRGKFTFRYIVGFDSMRIGCRRDDGPAGNLFRQRLKKLRAQWAPIASKRALAGNVAVFTEPRGSTHGQGREPKKAGLVDR